MDTKRIERLLLIAEMAQNETLTPSLVEYATIDACEAGAGALRAQREREANPGKVSDGYHTFDELYEQRAVLFSTLCRLFPESAWKSKLHADGTMFDGYFIVGIETPEGQYTYHYGIAKWDWFPVREIEKAPEWDGHTDEDVRRLWSLQAQQERETECAWCKGDWTDNFSVLDEDFCQPLTYRHVKFCPMCGRKLEQKEATHDNT